MTPNPAFLTLDHCIVYFFLILTLGIGLYAGRHIKTIKDYAIADKKYNAGILTITFLATLIGGGSTISETSNIFNDGIITTLTFGMLVFTLLFIGRYIAPKMKQFKNCLTLGDVIGTLYGKKSKILAGLTGSLFSIFVTSLQMLALGTTLETLLDIPLYIGLSTSSLLIVGYASFGGIKSVTTTDVLQFAVLIVIIPVIAQVAVQEVGGLQPLFQSLPPEKFNIFHHKNKLLYLGNLLSGVLFSVILLSPPFIQRMLMAANQNHARSMYVYSALVKIPFCLMIMLIGLSISVLYPHIPSQTALPYAIKMLLPIGAKGLAISGILAVIMSTADSYLNTAGLLLVHDVIQPIMQRRGHPIDRTPLD